MECDTPMCTTMTAIVQRVCHCELLACDCDTNREVIVHTPEACCFCVCDRVCITFNGAMTMSLPPQITATSIKKLCACGR